MRKRGNRGNILFMMFVLFLVTPWLLQSCGMKSGVVQEREKSYLKFTGNVKGSMAILDQEHRIDLTKAMYHKDATGEIVYDPDVLFEITPGKHDIQVERDGGVVVNRVFLIGNNQTKEIFIP